MMNVSKKDLCIYVNMLSETSFEKKHKKNIVKYNWIKIQIKKHLTLTLTIFFFDILGLFIYIYILLPMK